MALYHIVPLEDTVQRCRNLKKCRIFKDAHYPSRYQAEEAIQQRQAKLNHSNQLEAMTNQLKDQRWETFMPDFLPRSNADMRPRGTSRRELNKLDELRVNGIVPKQVLRVSTVIPHLIQTDQNRAMVTGIRAIRDYKVDPHNLSVAPVWNFLIETSNSRAKTELREILGLRFTPGSYHFSSRELKSMFREVVMFNRTHLTVKGIFSGVYNAEESVEKDVETMFELFQYALGVVEEAERGVWNTVFEYTSSELGSFKGSDENTICSVTEYHSSPLSRALIMNLLDNTPPSLDERMTFIKVSERHDSGSYWEVIRDSHGWIVNTHDSKDDFVSHEISSIESAYRVVNQFNHHEISDRLQAKQRADFIAEMMEAFEDVFSALGMTRAFPVSTSRETLSFPNHPVDMPTDELERDIMLNDQQKRQRDSDEILIRSTIDRF